MSVLNEVGRELKVSELKPRTIVWLYKEGRKTMGTMWVIEVGEVFVHFYAGEITMDFFALRCGPDLEKITDDSHIPMKMYEYLGEP